MFCTRSYSLCSHRKWCQLYNYNKTYFSKIFKIGFNILSRNKIFESWVFNNAIGRPVKYFGLGYLVIIKPPLSYVPESTKLKGYTNCRKLI